MALMNTQQGGCEHIPHHREAAGPATPDGSSESLSWDHKADKIPPQARLGAPSPPIAGTPTPALGFSWRQALGSEVEQRCQQPCPALIDLWLEGHRTG